MPISVDSVHFIIAADSKSHNIIKSGIKQYVMSRSIAKYIGKLEGLENFDKIVHKLQAE